MAEIYALIDPNTNNVRYIGKANDSEKRLKSHLRDINRRNYPVYMWMRKLEKNNQIPIVKVLLVTDNWKENEKRIISEYKENGIKLLNVAEGGDEPYCSKEVRASNARKVTKAIQDDPKRKKLHELKKMMASNLNFLKKRDQEAYNRVLDRLHLSAIKYPKIFGCYLSLKKV